MSSPGTKIYSDTHTTTNYGTAVTANTCIIAKDYSPQGSNVMTTTGNNYGVGGTNVEVDLLGDAYMVEDQQNKTISTLSIPIPPDQSSRQNNVPNYKLIDLKRADNLFVIRGYFTDNSAVNITNTSPAVSSNVKGKKKVLKAMLEQGGVVRLYWRLEAYVCTLKQVIVKDTFEGETDTMSNIQNVAKREFTIQMIMGRDIGDTTTG